MKSLLIWPSINDGPSAKRLFRRVLWGYPDLVKMLYDEVRPALVEAHDKGRRDVEEAERHGAKNEQAGNHDLRDVHEVTETTSGCPIPKSDTEEGDSSSDEFKEVSPTSEKKPGRLWRVTPEF